MPSTSDAVSTSVVETHRYTTDGRTVAYAAAGDADGTPVVVHHGTPGSRLFAALLHEDARAAGVRLVAPDRPGYGRSDPPGRVGGSGDRGDGADALRDHGVDLDALAAAADFDRAGVLAFSGGGPFALAAASDADRITRVALVSAAVPPAEGPLARLAGVPFAIRLLFAVSRGLARLRGPSAVVGQYTDREVSGRIARLVADDFREALRQGARAPARELRVTTAASVDPAAVDAPVRAWHGTEDGNAPLAPVRSFVEAAGGELHAVDADHLGTLLDRRRDALDWLAGG